ncbi:uncharacterized protein PITG_03845 [Phytophthora infestans T30-4]|uniref:J domain-containing protein n=1 Tax=Phytophthora infestans (strain T30-4) TaxID=403677 RepID=D0MYP0_PHYIT|nr:uncharacterized protein PITG_03845 [Phytophthora infestans T30-4]EEY66288.1 conserved hypothetical protein [Phytophthora infestans T30-4]|eukprot:XP_002906887.1 conserved hypothetical protein [Phytophthora infestans T30-4]
MPDTTWRQAVEGTPDDSPEDLRYAIHAKKIHENQIFSLISTMMASFALLPSSTMAPQTSEDQSQQQADPAWWWRSGNGRQSAIQSVTYNEAELLSAAVLCAALSSTKASPSATDALVNARAARELEMHVRKSPLPHTLQLPVLEYTTDYVLVESEGAVICAMRATRPSDIMQAVVGSAVPLSEPYMHRFGGSRVHAPFWKRVQRLDLTNLYEQAQRVGKVLLLCGHSIGGSIAKLAFCELPKADEKDKHFRKHRKQKNEPAEWMKEVRNSDREAALQHLPVAMVVGFGAPYAGNDALTAFLEPLGMNDRVVTIVNEFDCIPGILNIAHSAAMLAKTTERLVTIAKATKAWLNLAAAHECSQRFARHGKRSIQINATMNHYERLGVARNASDREIRRSYRALALRWHPDRVAHGSLTDQQKEVAEDIFKLLAESYEVLSNQESRRAYDSYLNRPPSRREEFMQYGTVDGITLDEAISTFKDAVDNISSQFHRVTDRFSSSSSTTVGHPLQHNGGKPPATTSASSGHSTSSSTNLSVTTENASTGIATVPASSSATQQVSSTARVGSSGVSSTSSAAPASSTGVPTSTSETSNVLSKTGEVVANKNTEISTQAIDTRSSSDSISSSSKSTSTSLKTVSVVGGAVAVAASVAIIVSAWSQFSEASRKKRQAAAVRDMPGDCLVLLIEDRTRVHRRQSRTPSIQLLQESKARQIKAFAVASTSVYHEKRDSGDTSPYLAKEAQSAIVELTQKDQEQDQDEKLIEEFFECAAIEEDAVVEAMAEEEFFDCVEVAQDIDHHFAKKHEKLRHPHGKGKICVRFPRGSKVDTPYGLGEVEDWRENTAVAALRFEGETLRYIDKKEISRGASTARELTHVVVEERRAELAERVITNYGLEETKTGDQITNVALAGAGGAVDSGLRAAGGLALANGVARSGTALGGMVAAPLAVASILVDIGKEFYDYRKKHTERKELGVLSTTSERLMRRDFRLKTGEVVVSRTTAAAGAGLGAYGVASAMTMWAAAGVATGPVGIVAATSAAVVGGVAGYFGGAKVYSLSTASYFKSQKHAKEHIDRLELGARVLFEEHDPAGTGEISKEACLSIMQKLYEISGDTSDFAYEASVEAIKDPSFEGPVTWRMFWIWVSTEAARSLKSLEHHELKPIQNGEGERKRDKVMRKLREAKQKHLDKHHQDESERDSTSSNGLDVEEVEREIHARAAFAPVLPGEEDNLDEVKATVEALVHSNYLTAGQAYSLYSQLDSNDPVEQVSAREIVAALQSEQINAEPESESLGEFELFPRAKTGSKTADDNAVAVLNPVDSNSEQVTSSQSKNVSKLPPLAPSSQKKKKGPKPQVDPRLDVMCSLMSTDGLKRFLETQYIVPEEETLTRHEDLHCLALASAVPPAPSSTNRAEKTLK